MKRLIPWIVALIALAWLAPALRPPRTASGDFNTEDFGKLPVLVGGRLKPFDTVARNSLLILSGKQVLRNEGEKTGATRWLLDVIFDSGTADTHPVFLIHNPEVLGLFDWQQDDRKRFSMDELRPFLAVIDKEGRQAAEVAAAERSPYQTSILNLFRALSLYQRLQYGMRPKGVDGFSAQIDLFTATAPEGFKAMSARAAGEEFDKDALFAFRGMLSRFEALRAQDYIRPVPARDGGMEWQTIGGALLGGTQNGALDPTVRSYAAIGDAYAAGDAELFNREVQALREALDQREAAVVGRVSFESLFNRVAPFYRSMGLYVLALLLACGSWLGRGPELRRSAFWLLVVALVLHSFGLGARMYLQGRPPVTNLYSSAVFIGWGTVMIGLYLERVFKDGIGAACSGAIGFVTLVIAHHLASSGDTLEMLQAVLDTNLWLAAHVVTITAGYSAMFLAGTLATIHIVRGVLTRSLSPELDKSLGRMVYGVICFALLFSFVGTVLGGIWADQSWGRFWGWDPKENGALLIVLWCALILHARWGGYIKRRGLMIMAVFGNVITAFSWFGVNMLGVGLHSYGFMNKAFPWLVGFTIICVELMFLARSIVVTDPATAEHANGTHPFSMQGRLNRACYLWITLPIGCALDAAIAVGFHDMMVCLVILVLNLPLIVVSAFAAVKRLHDIGRPGSHYWMLLIPIYGVYLSILLAFQKGPNTPNEYGRDPLAGH